VAPSGSSTNTGTEESPWDLSTGLRSTSVKPGDTVWIRAGTYTGGYSLRLKGTEEDPIIVRNYNDERVKLDVGTSAQAIDIYTGAQYVWVWGLEIMSSDGDRSDQTRRGNAVIGNFGTGIK
jgi:hypothetical protein